MKKILFALAIALALRGPLAAAEPIDGVWGMKFGASPEDARGALTRAGAELLCEYGYVPYYREAFYKVDFFGRKGHLLLRFSKKGLFLARFAFARGAAADEPPSGAAAARVAEDTSRVVFSKNYAELNAMLAEKYGASEKLSENGVVRGARWSDGGFKHHSVTLYESPSLSGSDTVLTYEDTGRR